jgi:hypothetical protein
MVVYVINPSYMEGRDWKDCSVKPAPEKKLVSPTWTHKPSTLVHTCNPSYARDVGKRITDQSLPGQKSTDPILKLNKLKQTRAEGMA